MGTPPVASRFEIILHAETKFERAKFFELAGVFGRLKAGNQLDVFVYKFQLDTLLHPDEILATFHNDGVFVLKLSKRNEVIWQSKKYTEVFPQGSKTVLELRKERHKQNGPKRRHK